MINVENHHVIGISGTREVVTREAAQAGRRFIRGRVHPELYPNESYNPEQKPVVVVHGKCQGWDATMHYAAMKERAEMIVLPPDKDKYEAKRLPLNIRTMIVMSPQPYHVRNQQIVDYADELLSYPLYPEWYKDSRRSGTWQTIRMARRKGIPVWMALRCGLIVPDDDYQEFYGPPSDPILNLPG